MRSLVAAFLVLASVPAYADDDDTGVKGRPIDKGTVGVGIIIGEPTGICAKLYLKDDQAIQAAVGGAFIGGGFQFHADYVFHPWILQDKESFVLPVYLGPGIILFDHNSGGNNLHFAFGIRGVVGMLFDFKAVPLDAFLEAAAVPEFETGGRGLFISLNVGAGVRYYF